MKSFCRVSALTSVSALTLCLAAGSPARAQSFTVQSGQTVDTQVMLNDGDHGHIEQGGRIDGVTAGGVEMLGANQSVLNEGDIFVSGGSFVGIATSLINAPNAQIENRGTITTLGSFGHGIWSQSDGTIILNSGLISTSGSTAMGILSQFDNAVITNDGTISTQGDGAVAIRAEGAGSVIENNGSISTTGIAEGIVSFGNDVGITNRGTISTTGFDSEGISSIGSNAVIENSGTISTKDERSDAIFANGPDTAITNSGVLSTEGDNASGIFSDDNNAVITNSGTILTKGAAAEGIISTDSDAVVTNSGTIISEQSHSIAFTASGATLNLLRGSVLQGDILFADSATATLNIGPGLSTALQLDGVPATITAPGMPLHVAGNMVYTADITAVGHEGEALGDLTSGIFSAIDGRKSGEAVSAPLSYAPKTTPHTAIFRTDDVPVREAWLQGFGGMREEDGEDGFPGYDQALAGIVSGIDIYASEAGTAGIFLGGSWAETEVELSQEIEAQSAFGGVYGTFGLGTATLDLALAAGWSAYDSERRVANNQVGLETAEADYDGWFVSPHLALTQPFVIAGQIVEAKASVHYAGLFLDGYDETGSSANLSVDERDVHVFVGRTGLSVPFAFAQAGGGVTTITPSFGIEGRSQFGDSTAAGSFMGTDIVIDLDNGETIGGFAGLKVEHQTAESLTLFAATEGLIEDDGAARIFAKGGVKARF